MLMPTCFFNPCEEWLPTALVIEYTHSYARISSISVINKLMVVVCLFVRARARARMCVCVSDGVCVCVCVCV